MKYLITMRPLESFMFGTEQTFSDPGMTADRRISYIATSNQVPEQTTILGALRFMLLSKHGHVKADYSYTSEELAKNEGLIGKESFSFFAEQQKFGAIHSISPVFLLKDGGSEREYLIPTPFCLVPGSGERGYEELKMSPIPAETNYGLICLPEKGAYDAKQGWCGGWYNLNRAAHPITPGKDIFRTVTNTSNSEQQDFFKKEMCILEKGYCFAVYADVDAELPKNFVGKMGRGFSAFHFHAEQTEEDITALENRIEEAFSNLQGQWHYALSDLVPEEYTAPTQFCIVSQKSVRNMQTNLSKKSLSVSDQINLIQAGSVYYGQKPEQKLRSSAETIGYNRIIRIGGKR